MNLVRLAKRLDTPLEAAIWNAWDFYQGTEKVREYDSFLKKAEAVGLSAAIAYEEDAKIESLGNKIINTSKRAERYSKIWRGAYNLSREGKIELDGKRLAKDMGKTLASIENIKGHMLKIKALTKDDLLSSEVEDGLKSANSTIKAFEAAIKMGQRGIKMSSLQKDLIKLAYDKPHFRAKILPILREAATKTADERTAGLPKGNIYWKQVTKDDDVEVGKGVFIVTQKGKKYVANWGSNDAQKAQQFLLQQSKKKAAAIQKTAINQDTQDFIDWIYSTRQGQALGTSEVVAALNKAKVQQKPPKKKRTGPRFQTGDEVIVNFKKAKADPRMFPATVDTPTGIQLDEKAWKKFDGKVGKIVNAAGGVTAKFGSKTVFMIWGQKNRGIPLYKYFPPTAIEAKSPKLELVYLAGGQAKEEAQLTVTNYLARGSQRGQQRPAYYYTGYSYGWRVGRNGPYFELLAQQRFQFNPDKVGDSLGQGGYAPRSFNPAIGQLLYLGIFNSRPKGWKSDIETWKAEAAGE